MDKRESDHYNRQKFDEPISIKQDVAPYTVSLTTVRHMPAPGTTLKCDMCRHWTTHQMYGKWIKCTVCGACGYQIKTIYDHAAKVRILTD